MSPTTSSSCTPARSSSQGRWSRCSQSPFTRTPGCSSRPFPTRGRSSMPSGSRSARAGLRGDRPARRLPLRHALPARGRRLLARHPRSRRGAARPVRPLPRHRPSTYDRKDLDVYRQRLDSQDFVWGAATASYQIEGAAPRTDAARASGIASRDARQGARRRHRRRRVRLLPPLPRRRPPHARARPRRLPLLDRLAARPPDGARQGQRSGARLLRPARRRAARERHRAVRDALPLGHAAGTRGRRRLAGALDRDRLRRVRRGGRRTARRPSAPLDDAQRAVGLRMDRALVGQARTRPDERGRRGRDRPPPPPLARLGGRGDPARGAGRASRDRAQPRTRTPASDTPEDEAAAWRVDGAGNRWFLDPIFRGSYPADLLDRNELVAPFVLDGDMETIAAPIDFLGVNNYFRFVVTAAEEGPKLISPPESTVTDMGWEVYPDGLPRCSCACGELRAARRSTSPRTVPPSETCACTTDASTTRSARSTSQTHIGAVAMRSSRTARPSAGTSSGACSTTSSGRGLLQAVRDRLRRLPDARADSEGQLLLVPRLHRQPARGAEALAARSQMRVPAAAGAFAVAVAALAIAGAAGSAGADSFVVHRLISDRADSKLVNTWSLAAAPGGVWWVTNEATATSTLYDAAGRKAAPHRQGRRRPDRHRLQRRATASSSTAEAASAPARFIFACEDGMIRAWAPTVPRGWSDAGRSWPMTREPPAPSSAASRSRADGCT